MRLSPSSRTYAALFVLVSILLMRFHVALPEWVSMPGEAGYADLGKDMLIVSLCGCLFVALDSASGSRCCWLIGRHVVDVRRVIST